MDRGFRNWMLVVFRIWISFGSGFQFDFQGRIWTIRIWMFSDFLGSGGPRIWMRSDFVGSGELRIWMLLDFLGFGGSGFGFGVFRWILASIVM